MIERIVLVAFSVSVSVSVSVSDFASYARAQEEARLLNPVADLSIRDADINSEGVRMSAKVYSRKGSEGQKLPTIVMCHGWCGTAKALAAAIHGDRLVYCSVAPKRLRGRPAKFEARIRSKDGSVTRTISWTSPPSDPRVPAGVLYPPTKWHGTERGERPLGFQTPLPDGDYVGVVRLTARDFEIESAELEFSWKAPKAR